LGRLFVIAGPSGAGKGSIVQALAEEDPRLWVATSVTTRPPRPGDADGVTYFFVDDATFDAMAQKGALLEWATVYGYKYGTPREKVEAKLAESRDVILEIDVQGAMQVKKRMPQAVTIFIEPPSIDELRRRLGRRGTDDDVTIEKRLGIAKEEISKKDRFDFVVMNDNLEAAIAEVRAIIDQARRNQSV